MPDASRMLDDGQWQTPAPLREQPDLRIINMYGVRVPDIVADPVERFHVGHRSQSHMRQGVAFLIEGLAQVRVQMDPVVARHPGRLAHEIGGDREG